ncbi:MAG: hypothetical protein ABSF89_14350 [Acidimicrobiales bacterium]|jgi:hypothetical protein
MRAHAHVENHIARLKDSGLCRFFFSSFEANANWMAVVMLGADLVRWFQLSSRPASAVVRLTCASTITAITSASIALAQADTSFLDVDAHSLGAYSDI